jgi:hypothetical protein
MGMKGKAARKITLVWHIVGNETNKTRKKGKDKPESWDLVEW